MFNKFLLILSTVLFVNNNISFSTDNNYSNIDDNNIDFNVDFFPKSIVQVEPKNSSEINGMQEDVKQIINCNDDIDFNINFPKESMNQDLNNNTINNNNNNNSSFIKLCSIIDNNSVAKDYDDVDFNIDFFPQNVKKEEKKQFSDTDRDSYNNKTNIILNNIVQGDIKQLPIDLRNIKPFEIDEVALQRSIQQYMAMSYNERQEFLNNIFKNDTKQIMQYNNNIKSDNNIGNIIFKKNTFDGIKISDQNNNQQLHYNNIENFNNNTQIQNSNLLNSLNNTSNNYIGNLFNNNIPIQNNDLSNLLDNTQNNNIGNLFNNNAQRQNGNPFILSNNTY